MNTMKHGFPSVVGFDKGEIAEVDVLDQDESVVLSFVANASTQTERSTMSERNAFQFGDLYRLGKPYRLSDGSFGYVFRLNETNITSQIQTILGAARIYGGKVVENLTVDNSLSTGVKALGKTVRSKSRAVEGVRKIGGTRVGGFKFGQRKIKTGKRMSVAQRTAFRKSKRKRAKSTKKFFKSARGKGFLKAKARYLGTRKKHEAIFSESARVLPAGERVNVFANFKAIRLDLSESGSVVKHKAVMLREGSFVVLGQNLKEGIVTLAPNRKYDGVVYNVTRKELEGKLETTADIMRRFTPVDPYTEGATKAISRFVRMVEGKSPKRRKSENIYGQSSAAPVKEKKKRRSKKEASTGEQVSRVVHFLAAMAWSGKPVPISVIADEAKSSVSDVQTVLEVLRRKGLAQTDGKKAMITKKGLKASSTLVKKESAKKAVEPVEKEHGDLKPADQKTTNAPGSPARLGECVTGGLGILKHMTEKGRQNAPKTVSESASPSKALAETMGVLPEVSSASHSAMGTPIPADLTMSLEAMRTGMGSMAAAATSTAATEMVEAQAAAAAASAEKEEGSENPAQKPNSSSGSTTKQTIPATRQAAMSKLKAAGFEVEIGEEGWKNFQHLAAQGVNSLQLGKQLGITADAVDGLLDRDGLYADSK